MTTRGSRPTAGKTLLRIRPMKCQRLNFTAETECIQCGRQLVVSWGALGAVFTIGNEIVGICCDDCLDPPSREKIARAREEAQQR